MVESADADPTLVAERRFHSYEGSVIPFFVRLLWVGFYCLAIYYCLAYLFPSLRLEFRGGGGGGAPRAVERPAGDTPAPSPAPSTPDSSG